MELVQIAADRMFWINIGLLRKHFSFSSN